MNTTRNKEKKHDKILMLAKSKLNIIEISHKEFITILKEKQKYEKMKDNLSSENEKEESIRLSSIKSKT